MEELTYYLKVFISVFVLVNPLEGIPLFLSSTATMDATQKSRIAKTAAIGVITILLFSLFLGKLVLQLFAITIPAFTLAGGIIIFLIAIKMVLGNDDNNADAQAVSKKDIAIVPLATPLLAGPGPISSIILYSTQNTDWLDWVMLTLVILIVGIATYLSLRGAAKMQVYLKDNGVSVLTRISGILVAAIAVEMIVGGLIQMINSLK